jgi:hypothetical protein
MHAPMETRPSGSEATVKSFHMRPRRYEPALGVEVKGLDKRALTARSDFTHAQIYQTVNSQTISTNGAEHLNGDVCS